MVVRELVNTAARVSRDKKHGGHFVFFEGLVNDYTQLSTSEIGFVVNHFGIVVDFEWTSNDFGFECDFLFTTQNRKLDFLSGCVFEKHFREFFRRLKNVVSDFKYDVVFLKLQFNAGSSYDRHYFTTGGFDFIDVFKTSAKQWFASKLR